MNFVEVIGNYDKASNRRRRIIGMAVVIAIIALFFVFNSIGEALMRLPEELFVEAPSPSPQSEIRNSPVPTELPNTVAATVFPSPTSAIVQSTLTPDAVEATRSWRSQAVQDAIRNRG